MKKLLPYLCWLLTLFLPFVAILDVDIYDYRMISGYDFFFKNPILLTILVCVGGVWQLQRVFYQKNTPFLKWGLMLSFLYAYTIPFHHIGAGGLVQLIPNLLQVILPLLGIGYYLSLMIIFIWFFWENKS